MKAEASTVGRITTIIGTDYRDGVAIYKSLELDIRFGIGILITVYSGNRGGFSWKRMFTEAMERDGNEWMVKDQEEIDNNSYWNEASEVQSTGQYG